MPVTYTFDVFSSLDGFGAAGGDWTGYTGSHRRAAHAARAESPAFRPGSASMGQAGPRAPGPPSRPV